MTGQTRQRSAYAHADTQGRTPLGVVLCACACALALCLGYLPQAALAWSDTTADFLVGQDYRSEVSGVDETFDYYMVADEAGAPMPAGARGRTYHWTMKRTETRTIVVQVPATARAEVYTYRFYQKVRSKKAGFTYDSTVFVGHL